MTKADEIREIAKVLQRTYPQRYESGFDTWLRMFNEFHRLMTMLHPRTSGVYEFKQMVDSANEIFAEPIWGPAKLKRPRMLVEDLEK